ncbi:MAG: AEC family transporter [Thermomicrobiales bacterium]
MLDTVIGALLPIVMTLALGYAAAWHHDFTSDNAAILNRMVMLYALPLDLLVGMVRTPRHELLASGWLALAIGGGMLASFAGVLLGVWRIGGKDPGTASLYALTVGGMSASFVGATVLRFLFGAESTIPISVAALALNLVQVPTCLVLLGIATSGQAGGHGDAGREIRDALREPVVWAPVAGLAIALSGVTIPLPIDRGLDLLGATTGGVALFASGIILYAQKVAMTRTVGVLVLGRNVLVPGAIWLILLAFGVDRQTIQEAVITLAIPAASVAVILAVRFRTAEREMASSLFASTLLSVVTLAGFIALTS